jgi:hypothetical protein
MSEIHGAADTGKNKKKKLLLKPQILPKSFPKTSKNFGTNPCFPKNFEEPTSHYSISLNLNRISSKLL